MSDTLDGMVRLRAVMRKLRSPDGCPWDREQTLKTLKPCLLEECHELLEAMENDDLALHREELGDVLLQVVFQCAIREEQGHFDLNQVAWTLVEKLVRRHPHVFGDTAASDTAAVLRNWEAIKQMERSARSSQAPASALDGVPATLPALLKAQRTQEKAARTGFDWPDSHGALAKVEEELLELREALADGQAEAIANEMGDLFFALVNSCRFAGINAEDVLEGATRKFTRRFHAVEAAVRSMGRTLKECSLAEMDAIWEQIKATESAAPHSS